MAGKMGLQVSSSLALAAAILSTLVLCLASAQSSSTSGCTTVIIGLAPCLGYITGNASAPSSSCCSQLSGVVNNQPQCLCVLLNGGASSFGLSINQTRALALPGACKISTPPVSLCKGPTASPSTPAVTPSVPSGTGTQGTPSTPPPSPSTVPSPGGSKSTPSTGSGGDSTSDGISSGSTSLQLIISAFMLAASTSFIQLPFY